jgi:hypothetical protein
MRSTNQISNAIESVSAGRPAATSVLTSYWALRVGAALCFIGHGAFGLIGKSAWLPYFAVLGIPEAWAWRLMPLVGAIDVSVGMAVLFAPRGLPLGYMVVWAMWTALLRPLAGESGFEAVERAGNSGVPLALLLLTAMPQTWKGATNLLSAPAAEERSITLTVSVLKWTTVLLLFGHGALGAVTGKAMLTGHYAAIGFPAETTAIVGWIEIGLASAIAFRPSVPLLIAIVVWKLASESLFIVNGAPIWEFVERAGSYAAPLALAFLMKALPAKAGIARVTEPRLGVSE